MFPHFSWLFAALLALGGSGLCLAQITFSSGREEVLVSCADILRLKPAEADRGLVARLEAVVTLLPGSLHSGLVIQDETAGIWVAATLAERKGLWSPGFEAAFNRLAVGDRVRIEGVTERGGFAPVLLPRRLEIIASGCELPPAPVVTMSAMLSGKHDVQRVTMTGVVQEVDVRGQSTRKFLVLRLVDSGGSVILRVPREALPEESELLDMEISVSGTLVAIHNSRAEMAGAILITSRAEDVKVLRRCIAPEKAPLLSLASLRPYEFDGVSSRRRRIIGTVTCWHPGRSLILQEGNAAVEVVTRSTQAIALGSVVEASGFVSGPHPLCRLENAVLRVLRQGQSPPPARVTVPELLDASHRKHITDWQRSVFDYHYRLVRVTGTFVEAFSSPDKKRRTLVLLSDGVLLPVHWEAAPQTFGEGWLPGSELAVEGIVLIQPVGGQTGHDELIGNGDVSLQLRDAGDVQVLAAASWWTRERLVKVAWAGLALIAVVLLVVGELSRRIHRQASELAGRIAQQKETEIRFLATLEERNRLGADMHDGLQQFLAGLSMQLEAAQGSLEMGRDAGPALHTARGLLLKLREDFRHCLNALRDTQAEMDIPTILERTSALIRTCHSVDTRVEVEGESVRLPGNVVANLMLVTQEAATNAVRHGKASLIVLRCHFRSDSLTVEVRDNGIGFDPDRSPSVHQYGLSSMRERMERLGGSLQIESTPQEGARIRATLPLPVPRTLEDSQG
ncbi:MAG: ATP-binding protein [Luteolibacter sp.]